MKTISKTESKENREYILLEDGEVRVLLVSEVHRKLRGTRPWKCAEAFNAVAECRSK